MTAIADRHRYAWCTVDRSSHPVEKGSDFRYLFTHPTADSLFAHQSLRALAKLVHSDSQHDLHTTRLVALTCTVCQQLLTHLRTPTCTSRLQRCVAENDHKDVTSLLRAFHADVLCVATGDAERPSFPATMQLVRHALTGLRDGPSVGEMLCMLGYATTCERLESAVRLFRAGDPRSHMPTSNATAAADQQ